ncbi:proton-conducting transporter transmembrane domain-containing protein [Gemmata sp.]|uniref:proton-conducting transporter transmembrane domain-containing protein n=1 Tax=Gemmata sp. TaxID=1914242 RepID=UPI003F7211B1
MLTPCAAALVPLVRLAPPAALAAGAAASGAHQLMTVLGYAVLLAPVALVAALGLPTLVGRPLAERSTARAVRWATASGLAAAVGALALMLYTGERHFVLDLGNWAAVRHDGTGPAAPGEHYHFAVKFEFDRLSVPLTILSFALCGTIGSFAVQYMHREPGFNRFFVLYAVFLTGMVAASTADSIETLFTGWELVGLSSALLVAFFHERPAPARNGLRVWVVYRVSDAALLLAAVVLHHMTGEGDFDALMGSASWPEGRAAMTADQALLVGLLLLVAAAGKSALVPFSGWLPRAMEGPTPSSAVFYGALSVHLGAFLLLRMSPLIALSEGLAAAVVALGLVTAAYAYLVGAAQTDIKSALSFASLAQVGVIVAEIGCGHWAPAMWYVALVHLLGHACLRTLQFIRAPTLLQDYGTLENALGDRLPAARGPLPFAPARVRALLYRFALERGYLDAALADYVARPFVRVFLWCDRTERRWTAYLSGPPRDGPAEPPRPADRDPAGAVHT